MKQAILTWVAFGIFALALPACHPKTNQQDERDLAPQLNRAYVLIDQSREAEAITLLEDLQRRGFTQPEVAVTLSSAYMHRAGLSTLTLYRASRAMSFDLPAREESMRVRYAPFFQTLRGHLAAHRTGARSASAANEARLNRALAQMLKAFAIVSLVVDDLRALPQVEGDRLQDLRKAHETLVSRTDLGRGHRLYRALIGIVFLKQDLFRADAQVEGETAPCRLPIDAAVTLVSTRLPILRLVTQDLHASLPGSGDEMRGATEALTEMQTQLANEETRLTLAQINQYQEEGWLCTP